MVNLAEAGVNSISPFAKAFSYLGAVLFVLFLAYLSTKFLANLNFSNVKNKHIKLIDKFFISADRSILLIKVDKKIYLVASDKTGLTILDNLSEDDLPSYFDEINNIEEKGSQHKKLASFADMLKNKRKPKL